VGLTFASGRVKSWLTPRGECEYEWPNVASAKSGTGIAGKLSGWVER